MNNEPKIILPESAKSKGIVRITGYRPGTAGLVRPLAAEAMRLMREAANETNERLRRIAQQEENTIRAHIEQIKNAGFLGLRTESHNLLVTSSDRGINQIMKHLAGTSSYALAITHGELGTGSTAPAESDTALTTPADRQTVTLLTISASNQITAQFFWADAELANATYREFGIYTASSVLTLSDGRLFNHALLSPVYTKATAEDTTVEAIITINN